MKISKGLAISEAERVSANALQLFGFVADMAAFLRFGLDNNLSEGEMLATLAHDIGGVEREGLDGLFLPRCSGYAKNEVDSLTQRV